MNKRELKEMIKGLIEEAKTVSKIPEGFYQYDAGEDQSAIYIKDNSDDTLWKIKKNPRHNMVDIERMSGADNKNQIGKLFKHYDSYFNVN